MIEFPDYEHATNAAYNILQHYDGVFPRIDIGYILLMYSNIRTCSYSKAAEKLGITHNEFTYDYASSEHGFTVANYNDNRFIIYYNDWKDEKTIRFTMAHELGHIILKHRVDDKTADKEANCFARNILCPVHIIKAFNLKTPNEYVECFDISIPMAKACVNHFKSDIYYIAKESYNTLSNKICYYMTGYTLTELYDCYSFN